MTEHTGDDRDTPAGPGTPDGARDRDVWERAVRERDARDRDLRDRDPRDRDLRDRDLRDRDARDRDGGGRRDPVASVADEAMRLFGAVQDRAAREIGRGLLKGTAAGLGQALGGGGRKERDVWEEAVSAHDEDEYICRACPVCRAIAAQRESGTGVTDHLAAAGGELFAAFRQAVDVIARPSEPRRPREDPPDVEHIDLG
ncbi:hypothetical protein Misp01_56530 [Microtetraspora sp. NBRC 13810]|uniref:hypothetical protein n=1 Tax=Microtetraspora sp. NBRC 13810 TaxID=3030990 RepID=UPI0024A283BA|nr:hypothetical protein [Microtetraspora sp. NBRC 13810]GLW10525.1 hypothetical protein Misp01_56530 [Microtetraspora sp. NBRC 13810]